MEHVTLVTGASKGIGAAVSRRLAATGHAVVLGYHADADGAQQVVEAVTAAGGRAVAVRLDTTDSASVVAAFDVAESLGRLTGLVNNAGVTSPIGAFVDLDESDLRRVVDVNVIGYVLCAQQAARRLGEGGSIVNVSSAAAGTGSPGEYVHYAASKAAVETLTVGLAKELAPRGIRVNTVSPGIIATGIHAHSGEPGRARRMGPALPAGRAGEPDEVAAAVAWLMSDDASYTSGATLRVTGAA